MSDERNFDLKGLFDDPFVSEVTFKSCNYDVFAFGPWW